MTNPCTLRLLLSTLLSFYFIPFSGWAQPQQPSSQARLLRFPDIHEDKVVFTYAGDLYTVGADGGQARRLTTGEGYEMFAHFSPDGSQIAFTGQYDGNTEVFVVPAEGGQPRRITYTATLNRDDVADRMGPNNVVLGWTPQGDSVLFRSRGESFNSFKGKVYAAPLSGDLPRQLPFSVASWMSYGPEGRGLAMNRVFREFRTWKGYRGGMADDIWLFDFATGKSKNLTSHPAQDVFPMYIDRNIYFASDRDGRMNLYRIPATGGEATQLTTFEKFDLKFPGFGPNAIIMENGGYLYRYDLEEDRLSPIPVELNTDQPFARETMVKAHKDIHYMSLHPKGERLALGGRGDLFTVAPEKNQPTRNLSQTDGEHERYVSWSPDGERLAFTSDRSGEYELYVQPADGSEPPRRITDNGAPFKYQPVWSPDGEKLLWSDRSQRLYYAEVESGELTEVFQSGEFELRDYSWSPDSRWVAYTRPDMRTASSIWLYDTEENSQHAVTSGFYAAQSPEFSPNGKYLYYSSARHFDPTYSQTEWNHAFQNMDELFLVLLEEGTANPLEPASPDEAAQENKEKDKKKKEETVEVAIDFDGLESRTLKLPAEPSRYGGLRAVPGGLVYLSAGPGNGPPTIRRYDLGEDKDAALGAFSSYDVSADGQKIALRKGAQYFIADLPPAKALRQGSFTPGDPLDLSGMEVRVDRQREWKHIYQEAWRQMRDFFYDPGMHGVDWQAQYDKYRPLLEHVAHRNDLTYVIGEMIGELNIGHAYVGGGDRPQPERHRTGLLGAELEPAAEGTYRIARILEGANWSDRLRSPLQEVGLEVEEGDYLLALNGQPTSELANPYQALVGRAGQPTPITVADDPEGKNRRELIVKPLPDESELRYHVWVQERMARADELSDGKVGYLHIPDMVQNGLSQFARYFYPQVDKEALIIDVRGNGGGNVSPMIIERLRRVVGMGAVARNSAPYVKPGATHIGPKATLIDAYTASDGDLFSYQFRYYELGPLIGTRTWGGVVGIRGSLPFVDGGYLRKPEFAHYGPEGREWIIENEGVSPDIAVEQDPHRAFKGEDPQLARAVQELLRKLEEANPGVPPVPEYPDKSDRR